MTIDRQVNKGGHPEAEQGDINTTAARRRYWERNLSGEARAWFEEDTRYFLHQSLSTPVINVIAPCRGGVDRGPQRETVSRHARQRRPQRRLQPSGGPAGRQEAARRFAHLLPAAVHEHPGRSPREKAGRDHPRRPVPLALLPRGERCDRDGAQARKTRHRPIQDDLLLGLLPRGGVRGGERGGRGALPRRSRAARSRRFSRGVPELLPQPLAVHERGGCRRRMSPADRADHAAGAGDGGDHRRARLGKSSCPEQAVLGRGQGAVREVRRPFDLRRGHRGVREDGQDVRQRALPDARHPGPRQIARRGDRPPGGDRDKGEVQLSVRTAPSATTPTRRTPCRRRRPWRRSR